MLSMRILSAILAVVAMSACSLAPNDSAAQTSRPSAPVGPLPAQLLVDAENTALSASSRKNSADRIVRDHPHSEEFARAQSISREMERTIVAERQKVRSSISASRCNSVSELAEVIMEHRQAGTDMAKIMGTAQEDATRQVIIMAYDSPRFHTERNQQRAVQDFKNDAYLACIKGS